jgi:prepilin-type N-terminal cleavage/methylation domain-containing protein
VFRNQNRFSFMSIGLAKLMNRRTGRDIALRCAAAATAAHRPYHRGFTLLEILLAVAILGMMALAIFRFVQTNLTALQFSSETAAADAQYDGLRDLLTTQWQSLTPLRARMVGEPFKLNDRERDEIRWNCGAGPALLTRYAPGEFTVVLRLQSAKDKSDQLDLGILRKSLDDSDETEGQETWVPLIKNVGSLEIAYFDPNANTWLPRWPGGNRMPSLVKVSVGRPDAADPWEAVIPLRRTPY